MCGQDVLFLEPPLECMSQTGGWWAVSVWEQVCDHAGACRRGYGCGGELCTVPGRQVTGACLFVSAVLWGVPLGPTVLGALLRPPLSHLIAAQGGCKEMCPRRKADFES